MRNLLLLIFFVSPFWLVGQVSTEPDFPSADEEIRIIYDATQGTSGLQGASKVYMHAGVILDSPTGTGWQNVVGNWGQDDGIGEMTPVAGVNDQWEITISPRSYFGLDANQVVYRIGMVFRNADGSKEGKNNENQDIFVEVNNGQFSLVMDNPSSRYGFYNTSELINVELKTSESALIEIYIDDVLATSASNATVLTFDHQAIIDGNVHTIVATASNGEDSKELKYSYTSTPVTSEVSLPAGVKKGINYNSTDPTQATLVLEAPGKEYIFAIGDFTDWQLSNDHLLHRDGELFWITLEGLTPKQEYIFQYLIDGDILIADPYTDKISDPWDDNSIENTRYPGLIDYPVGLTENRASVLQTDQDEYEWTNTDFVKPDKDKLVIYELLVRDFTDERTYDAVINRLDYLQDLGITALELMPVNEFEGNLSWGYNPNFYFAPDKYYGSKNKLKELIDECHNRGIAVLIDLVLNHSFGSSPLVRMYWNESAGRPASDNPWYNETHNFANTAAHWGYDFDHESSYTQALVDSVNHYWISEYRVDGFRFDFTKGFGNRYKGSNDEWASLYDGDRIRLLKRMADKIWEVDENSFVIFEHLAENREEEELADYGIMLWGNMNHTFRNVAKENPSALTNLYHELKGWSEPNLVGYMESHDEERVAWDVLKSFDLPYAMQRLKLNAAFFFTVPGPKMLWQFQEMGYDEELNNDRLGIKPTHWEYLDDPDRKALYDVYSSLIKLRTQTEYFENQYFTWSASSDVKWINVEHPNVDITIVGNFDGSSVTTKGRFTKNGTWHDYFSGETIEVIDFENQEIILNEGEFKIYTSTPIENYLDTNPADYVAGYSDEIIRKISLYPNPGRNFITIESALQIDMAEVKDIQGRKITTCQLNGDRIDISNLDPGIYVLDLTTTTNEHATARFIKE